MHHKLFNVSISASDGAIMGSHRALGSRLSFDFDARCDVSLHKALSKVDSRSLVENKRICESYHHCRTLKV